MSSKVFMESKSVKNEIEVLPTSMMDDRIRALFTTASIPNPRCGNTTPTRAPTGKRLDLDRASPGWPAELLADPPTGI